MRLEALRSHFSGILLQPGDDEFEAARVVWNGMIDRRPAVIARCRNAGDVAASVTFARENGLSVAIRSGGHNVAGYAVCEAGVMVDLSAAPAGLSDLAEFSTIPDDPAYPEQARGRRVVALAHVYDGPAEEGERVCVPLRGYGGPLVDFSGTMPYRTIQTLYDPLFPRGPDRCYWKSTYLRALDRTIIEDVLAWLAKRPSDMTFASIWKFAGAMQDVPAEATSFGDRSAPFMLSLDGIWSSAADDDANIGWVRTCWNDMQRHSTGRMYLNFPGHGEGDDLVKNALGPRTYTRLQQVKRRYDPANLFRLNQNVIPAALTMNEGGGQLERSA